MFRLLPVLAVGLTLWVQPALAEQPVVRLVEFDAMVNPITQFRILRAIDDAEEQGDDPLEAGQDQTGQADEDQQPPQDQEQEPGGRRERRNLRVSPRSPTPGPVAAGCRIEAFHGSNDRHLGGPW